MRLNNRRSLRIAFLPWLPIVLLLTACGSASGDATPTMGAEAIFTSAAQTFEAQIATQMALRPRTSTPAPSPSPLPTLAPISTLAAIPFTSSTPLAAGTSDCDNAAYVADVTVPDGSIMAPSQRFTKTWSMYNSGTCAWSTSYTLVFLSGDDMGGSPGSVPLPVPVGNQADVSVSLTAPEKAGTYKGTWQLQNDKKQPFGSIVYVQIQVGAGASVSTGPTSATGTITISGNAGRPEVTLTYEGTKGGNGSVLSDANGDYLITVPAGWSGSITPSKGTYTFAPARLDFPNLDSDQTDQDFTAN